MGKEMRRYAWKDGKTLTVGEQTMVMGILNYTPDSFSDGGKWNRIDDALRHMEQMVRDGAQIIDVGAESTRPGSSAITADEEISRLELLLPRLAAECPVPISIDTYKAETAKYALDAGVHIINDVWGLQYEAEPGKMADVAAAYGVPVVVMHNRDAADCADVMADMKAFFDGSAAIAAGAGMQHEQIIIDPGIGFGKTFEQNIYILQHLQELTRLPYPVLLGVSRKSCIGRILDLPVTERMEGTGAACVAAVLAGCAIVRVHDVKPIARMCRVADALR